MKSATGSLNSKIFLKLIDEGTVEKDDFNKNELYAALYGIEDEILRTEYINKAEAIATSLRKGTSFKRMIATYERSLKKQEFKKYDSEHPAPTKCNYTDFSALDVQFRCGSYEASDKGIFIQTDDGQKPVCKHPIWISNILKSAETGEYKVKLQYVLNHKIVSQTVPRKMIATKSQIIGLSDYGVGVSDMNATRLIGYLSEIETSNSDIITEKLSTSRLGWIPNPTTGKHDFLPYDSDIELDSESSLKPLIDSIQCVGDCDKTIEFIKELRAKNNFELLVNMAAALASPLIEPSGNLPFIVSLWGGTGIGKTVVLQICASFYANPERGFIADAKTTNTAIEVQLNARNSLPFLIDDLAQIATDGEVVSKLIYTICSGKGKGRSNQKLGINRTPEWTCCTITNGERSMVDESMQGGAINRVIDVNAGNTVIFNHKDGNKAHNFLIKNYGWIGWMFVNVIKLMSAEQIQEKVNYYGEELRKMSGYAKVDKEDKQIAPMAMIMAADDIAQEYIFKDGIRLDPIKCLNLLKDRNSTDENQHAYERLMDEFTINKTKFGASATDDPDTGYEYWGWYDAKEGYYYVIPSKVDDIIRKYNYQPKAFKSWCIDHNLIQYDAGRMSKQIRIKDRIVRYFVIKDKLSEECSQKNGYNFEQINAEECPFQ